MKNYVVLLDWNGRERWCQVDKYDVGGKSIHAQAAKIHGRSGQTASQGKMPKLSPSPLQMNDAYENLTSTRA